MDQRERDRVLKSLLEGQNFILANLRYISTEVIHAHRHLQQLSQQLGEVMAVLDPIQASVERQTGAVASAVALITGLAQAVRDLISNGTVDPADVENLAAELDANSQSLSDAVAANPLPTDDPNA